MPVTQKQELKNVPIADLIPYTRNPRKNDAAVQHIAASLKEYGFVKNSIVVDEEMVLITGHTTMKAMQALGWTEAPEVTQVFGLTEAQKKAYRIADNRLGELAEWDTDLLALEFDDLKELDFDTDLTGFDSLNTVIDREPDTDRAGASPWERMGADAADGVILTFGAITTRISSEIYGQFLARCEQEPSLAGFVEGVILNACGNP